MDASEVVDELVEVFGSARQALVHLPERELNYLGDDVLNALFVAAGLGHLLLPIDDADEPMDGRRRGRR